MEIKENEDTRVTNIRMPQVKSYRLLILLTIILANWDCSAQSQFASETVQVRTLNLDHGWGYQVLFKNKVVFEQTTKPVIDGTQPFQSETDALIIGLLVKERLLNRLPAVSNQLELIETQMLTAKYHRELFFK